MRESNSYMMKYDRDITAVIATLGEPSLEKTIESILSGSVVPYRIALCIPNDFKYRVARLSERFPCIDVVATRQQGQVSQRIVGFRSSNSKYTLQLDSDVVVDRLMVENLKNFLLSHPRSCVGPVIFRNRSESIYSFLSSDCNVYTRRQKKLITWILNGSDGFQSGKISRGGVGFGPDLVGDTDDAQWLPGCCIMHETDNLITEEYFPWYGKAFGEDLFHSHHIESNGVNIFFDRNSKLYVDFPEGALNDAISLFKGHCRAFWIGLQYVRLKKKSKTRFCIYTVLNMIFLLINKIYR